MSTHGFTVVEVNGSRGREVKLGKDETLTLLGGDNTEIIEIRRTGELSYEVTLREVLVSIQEVLTDIHDLDATAIDRFQQGRQGKQ